MCFCKKEPYVLLSNGFEKFRRKPNLNLVKFVRTTFLKNISGWALLDCSSFAVYSQNVLHIVLKNISGWALLDCIFFVVYSENVLHIVLL